MRFVWWSIYILCFVWCVFGALFLEEQLHSGFCRLYIVYILRSTFAQIANGFWAASPWDNITLQNTHFWENIKQHITHSMCAHKFLNHTNNTNYSHAEQHSTCGSVAVTTHSFSVDICIVLVACGDLGAKKCTSSTIHLCESGKRVVHP